MRTPDLFAFFFYVLFMVIIGLYFYSRNKSSIDFTVGDNSIPAWVISLSIFATFVSSISYLALPGSSYLGNWNSFAFSLSLPVAAFMAVKYFVPLYREVNSPSAYTFLESRFGVWARVYASSMYLLTQIMRVGTILYLMALVPNMMFGWNLIVVIILTSIVVMIYSVMGGIKAVIWTDAIQAIVLIGGALAAVMILSFKMPDGMTGIMKLGIESKKFELGSYGFDLSQPTFWVVLIYGVFINLQNFGVDQNYIQRYMTSRTLREAQRSAFWGAILYIPVSMIFLFIGTALYAVYHSGALVLPDSIIGASNADKVFPHFIAHEMPPGITGLLLASIFAAGMSTISTSYNSSATILLADYFQRFPGKKFTDKQNLTILYLCTMAVAVLGTIVAVVMIDVKSALDSWWKLASIFSGGMLGLFLLGAFTRLKNVSVALVAVIIGLTIIILMSVPVLLSDTTSYFHPYLTIVFGTTVIFITGFLLGHLIKSNQRK